MRSAASLIIAVLVFLAGAMLWAAGKQQQQVASAERSFVTLQYSRAADELDAVRNVRISRLLARALGADVPAARQGAAQYWLGEYERFTALEDPAMARLAADAAYRAARRAGGMSPQLAARLDAISKRYAEILRNDPDNTDAAYNYEFVLRLRSAVIASKQPKIAPGDPPPSELTVHGVPGGPPPDSDGKKFRMIVPMRPEERLEAEEAGRAQQKARKG